MRPLTSAKHLVLSALLVSILQASPASAQVAKPSVLEDVGIDQQLGEQIDLNLQFRHDAGNTVPLSNYFHGQPVVLVPFYLTCSSLCPMTLNSLMQALHIIGLNAGKDFEVVAFSFEPK